jgi:hypothetical protein
VHGDPPQGPGLPHGGHDWPATETSVSRLPASHGTASLIINWDKESLWSPGTRGNHLVDVNCYKPKSNTSDFNLGKELFFLEGNSSKSLMFLWVMHCA